MYRRSPWRLALLGCLLFMLAVPVAAAAAELDHAGPPAAAACDRPHEPGRITIPVESDGHSRPVLVYIPAGYDGTKTPLVFNLHGSGGSGAGQIGRLEPTADRHTFIVAAPSGAVPVGNGWGWNIPGVPVFGGMLPPADAPSDIQYASDIIDTLAEVLCIDSKRVYSTGHSGGGRMSSLLGCALADRIAAIAPVVGLRAGNPDPADTSQPDPATCTPSRPVPVITFSGTNDNVNPFPGGGQGYWLYGIEAAEQRWAEINGCNQVSTAVEAEPNTNIVTYFACESNARIVSYHRIGAGHVWGNADLEAMWAFFQRNTLPGPRT